MRKTIIFGAIAALFGLVAAAQASNDDAKPGMKDDSQITRPVETVGRGDMAEHKERAEVRERADDAREHHQEAREREHESGAYEDRD